MSGLSRIVRSVPPTVEPSDHGPALRLATSRWTMPAAPPPPAPAPSTNPALRGVRPPHQRTPLPDRTGATRTRTAQPLGRPTATRPLPGASSTGTAPTGAAARTAPAPTTRASVVVAGVGPVFGHGLCAALEGAGMTARSVGETTAVAAAVTAATTSCVVVVPATQCTDVLQVLDAAGVPDVALVVLLADAEPESYLAGLRAGARGFVPAGAQLPQIAAIVSGAARGFRLLPPAVVRALCRSLVTESRPEVPAREQEWLRQIARGVTVADLAQRSAYSEREMYRLLGAVYRRLGANNRTEALFAAQRAGLLDDGGTAAARPERSPRRTTPR